MTIAVDMGRKANKQTNNPPSTHMCCMYFSYRYIIPIFVWFLTCCIVFALKYVQPVVSVLTFFKGSLLLGTVSNNWTMSLGVSS